MGLTCAPFYSDAIMAMRIRFKKKVSLRFFDSTRFCNVSMVSKQIKRKIVKIAFHGMNNITVGVRANTHVSARDTPSDMLTCVPHREPPQKNPKPASDL